MDRVFQEKSIAKDICITKTAEYWTQPIKDFIPEEIFPMMKK